MAGLSHMQHLVPPLRDNASALSDARFDEEVGHGALRAFDKAVRRKPPVVAADAGPMQIQLREGAVLRCAESCAAEHDRRQREMKR